MTVRAVPTAPSSVFTLAEWQALRVLRRRYRPERDLFSDSELACLRFVRWLYQRGRLPS